MLADMGAEVIKVDMLQALADPQTLAREMVVEVEHSTLGPANNKARRRPMRPTIKLTMLCAAAALIAAPAGAAWQPSKPIEFIATAGPGGGTDNLARTVQSIITKYKLTDQPIVVVNKGGGSGAEGYTYGKSQVGDPHKVIFGTSNAWQQP